MMDFVTVDSFIFPHGLPSLWSAMDVTHDSEVPVFGSDEDDHHEQAELRLPDETLSELNQTSTHLKPQPPEVQVELVPPTPRSTVPAADVEEFAEELAEALAEGMDDEAVGEVPATPLPQVSLATLLLPSNGECLVLQCAPVSVLHLLALPPVRPHQSDGAIEQLLTPPVPDPSF
jgi:hypothetical protein